MTHRTEICPRAPPGEKQLFASAAANTGPDPPAACGRGNIVRSTAASVAAANEQVAEEKARRAELHKSANMRGMDDLFDEIMVRGDGDMAKLKGQQQIADPQAQLRDQVDAAAEEYVALVLQQDE